MNSLIKNIIADLTFATSAILFTWSDNALVEGISVIFLVNSIRAIIRQETKL